MLAQMTASGLQIIFTIDEVDFIQNLVFYIENAYRIPDYGIWERGDKCNHGLPELNASSIGMAKAALEAINELDLFGARGGAASVIHCKSDKIAQCAAILHSMLPRESTSKEIDAGLLGIISFPGFACDDESLCSITRTQIIDKLQGRYGCCRFLRDGYKTVKEDPTRLYYEPAELKVFENIECEWPLFWCYLILDGIFRGNKEQVDEYSEALDEIMVRLDDGTRVVPEFYYVPADKVDLEYKNPHSQDRLPGGKTQPMWTNSLHILSSLLREGFIAPGEVDPLNRRIATEPKPDLVVQVCLLAEDVEIVHRMAEHGIEVEHISAVEPIRVYHARVLSYLNSRLGVNDKMGLSGNVSSDHGLLSTSKLYTLHGHTMAFVPQFLDQHQFYLALDNDLLADICKSDLAYLRYNWRELGRPTITVTITSNMIDHGGFLQPAMLNVINKMKNGYINGVQVTLGKMSEFINTSCIKKLSFLETTTAGQRVDISDITSYLHSILSPAGPKSFLPAVKQVFSEESFSLPATEAPSKIEKEQKRKRRSSVHGIISRTRSIDVDNLSQESHVAIEKQNVATGRRSKTEFSPATTMPPIVETHLPRTSTPNLLEGVSRFKRSASLLTFIQAVEESKEYLAKTPPRAILRTTDPAEENAAAQVIIPSERRRSWTEGPLSPRHEKKPTPLGVPQRKISGSFHLLTDMAGSSGGIASMTKTPSWVEDKELIGMYKDVEIEDLLKQLTEVTSLRDQADIVHYLYAVKGLEWDTKIGGKTGVTVKYLIEELYYKSAQFKVWSLVRHTAGILGKQVEQLAHALTDLLVRQKQVSVGLPPEPREKTITAPLPPREITKIIREACGDDKSSAVLTQEILVYLAMFIRTEPKLFHEMLRLRVGLIIQVMTTELARTINCPAGEAYEHLMTLSPYELKDLLYHILSSKEFGVSPTQSSHHKSSNASALMERQLSIVSHRKSKVFGVDELQQQVSGLSSRGSSKPGSRATSRRMTLSEVILDDENADDYEDRAGQWLRRRRLDGALNRAPSDFYTKVWKVLERCQGLSIDGHLLSQNLTREMTPHEFKFALRVESVLNLIPQPEYRQLMVEALMVLSLVVENDWLKNLGGTIRVDRLVIDANEIFLVDQGLCEGDATLCCTSKEPNFYRPYPLRCGGIAGVCLHFYDSARAVVTAPWRI
ncbi:probable phosphorylase b kinase regulatory subunit alpha isoform X1 [Amphiura filiformis]|uniref:probable phosphorylase b kinase regulatory subunit alpha isoform X1 n=1 Tax=Amphiura filiformis TaxID=82378 RepID=UPI003B225D4C